ncbi:MAG: hypothetical protein IJ202_03370 [Bacteroidales bacterium]|nr:hypothetical protein [Bacteroidales bacterium]
MKYMSLSSPFGIRIIIVSTCILVGALTVCAQDSSVDRIGPPDTQYAPNAAAIGQYGKVPVSYFNGLPNITIPLTEVKGKGITIPLQVGGSLLGISPEQIEQLIFSHNILFVDE